MQIILATLNSMVSLKALQAPIYELHPLKGKLKGLWAVSVSGNWRITFRFDKLKKDVYVIDYQDYH